MEGQARGGEQDLNHDVDRGTMADSEALEDLGRGTMADHRAVDQETTRSEPAGIQGGAGRAGSHDGAGRAGRQGGAETWIDHLTVTEQPESS